MPAFLEKPDMLRCTGKLKPGEYRIQGDVSSQFISGLLFAGALIPGQTKISVTGKLESKPYVDMTCQALETFGCRVVDLTVTGGKGLTSPGAVTVEGDWSNGAFFLGLNTLGSKLEIQNLSEASLQGDQAAAMLLPQLKEVSCTISAADIPDLVPVLAVVAACCHGAVFTDIRRLRMKESNRVASVRDMIIALRGRAEADENTLIIYGTGLTGGTVDCRNDHRIAMSAAVGATVCEEPVILLGTECVEKSYPEFFEIYRRLGGNYEQYQSNHEGDLVDKIQWAYGENGRHRHQSCGLHPHLRGHSGYPEGGGHSCGGGPHFRCGCPGTFPADFLCGARLLQDHQWPWAGRIPVGYPVSGKASES